MQQSEPDSRSSLPWSAVLRALREARGVTQAGWAVALGVSDTTVRRWERGAAVPTADVEQTLRAHCEAKGLFRAFDQGPLRGPALTPAVLGALLAEARLATSGIDARSGATTGALRDDHDARVANAARLPDAAPTSSSGMGTPRAPALRLLTSTGSLSPPAVRQPAHHLPAPTTPLIGRQALVEAVQARLLEEGVRLLTLTGPPGTGKTRLAVEVAWGLVDDFSHGVCFVDLTSIRDPTHVIAAVAHALDVREGDAEPLPERLQAYLASKRLLLVLDNFEQVLDAAPEVAALLAGCPRLTVLATSRAALRLRGEHRVSVPPLTVPQMTASLDVAALVQAPAVALFVQRAQAVQPEFELLPHNGQAVGEICIRLDGLPLAIELAAARIPVLPPQALRERLKQRLSLLTSGARDAPGRHQTLRAAITWSYELLSPVEQRLFRRLSVFAGGATLAAAAAVLDASEHEPELLEGLTGLVDQGLLYQAAQPDGEPRFRMLETLREYAGELLAAHGEAAATRSRHATYFLALGEQSEVILTGPAAATQLALLDTEHDNLRATLVWSCEFGARAEDDSVAATVAGSGAAMTAERALRLAAALGRFWWMRGYLSEGRRWLERVLSALPSPGEARAKALCWAGNLATTQGDHAPARVQLEESLALFRAQNNPHGIADTMETLGNLALAQGDLALAGARLEESLAIRRALDDREGIAEAFHNLGRVALARGDYRQAVVRLKEGLAIFHALGNQRGVAKTLLDVGEVALAHGDYAEARARLAESLAILRALGDQDGIAKTIHSLGDVALAQGDHAQAQTRLEESLAIFRELGSKGRMGKSIESFAALALAEGESLRAVRLFGAAARLRLTLSTPVPPADRAAQERSFAAVRVALGDETFAAAWSAGMSMSLDQAIVEAMPRTSSPHLHEQR